MQPWNSVKVTFDIPKEAADRLHLLALQGNVRLIELGILSVEIVGQSNAIVVNSSTTNPNATATTTTTTTTPTTANPTTNSKDLSVASASSSSSSASASTAVATATTVKTPVHSIESIPSSSSSLTTTTQNFAYDTKIDDHRHKRVKLENDTDQPTYTTLTTNNNNNNFPYKSSTTVNLMQPPSTIGHPVGHYITQPNSQILHRQTSATNNNYGRISYSNSISPTHPNYINSKISIVEI